MSSNEPRSIDDIEDEIAELSARIDAASYRLLTLIREMDERVNWEDRGCRSCAHWLSWRIGLDLGAAREKVRVAHALASLPKLSDALRRGRISYSKVRAITRIAVPETESDLLEIAEAGTASHVEKLVRLYRRAESADEMDKAQEQLEKRELRYHYDDDGMLVVRARLTPEQGALFCNAIQKAEKALFAKEKEAQGDPSVSAETSTSTPEVSASQRRADGLVGLCKAALSDGLEGKTAGCSSQVVVHVDAEVLANKGGEGRCELESGSAISAETCRRLSCDAKLSSLFEGKDGSVNAGRTRRTISGALRRALQERDKWCQFPGCGCTWFLQGHHVQHWADGGPTDLENLIRLCSFHHGLVHEGGFRVERGKDGEFVFLSPKGERVNHAWRDLLEIDEPLAELRRLQEAEDFVITAETSVPHWEGEQMDYDWTIVEMMHSAEANRTENNFGSG